MLADKEQVQCLDKVAASSEGPEEIVKTFDALVRNANLPVERVRFDTQELYQIDILANNTCNFHCIYCYSAAGRSNTKLRIDQITPLIDYLFDGRHNASAPYAIHFSGGGEPLLSIDIIRQTIDYIESACSHGNGHPYRLGLVTNGSLLTDEIASYLHQKNVEIVISFEILEFLQNKERGSYAQVSANIDSLTQNGIPFSIRTTFTSESVPYMNEMVDTVHRRFPGIRALTFDTVLSADLFRTPKELENYYSDFLDAFYKAREYADPFGIKIMCLPAEPLLLLRDRTCAGKFVLTPEGKISACSRVSSPKEKNYEKYEYGEIREGCLYVDQNRFEAIMKDCNIYSQPMCSDCFAKWNCGGGCRLFHHSFDERFESVRCDFVRNALRRHLFSELSRSFHRATGKKLKEHIEAKIKNNEL